MLSVVCEAFHCVPSVAERELDQHHELVFEVLDLRAYGQAFHRYREMGGLSDKAKRAMLREPMVQAVQANEFEMRAEEITRGQRDGDGGDGPDHDGV